MSAGNQVISTISGEVIATNVTFEEYLEKYAADFCELVEGNVIKMSPVHERHDIIGRYLAMLFEAYFDARPIGVIRQAPFVMKVPAIDLSREPDIQVILNTNLGKLAPTYMEGPADICIEIVSQESIQRDHGDKLKEYEKGGVDEYWIMDPIHQECRFFRLNAAGIYIAYKEDTAGNYSTPKLPGLLLHTATLWQSKLPGFSAIYQAIQAMLKP